ncbi:PQQ-dependent sugar dehydrogenase [Longivirga aurantiaca]|uniref:PQQ-dependent sugar dehydrogenase n=1 Tax=Longivirga aurantiaca TaxID=1837743 RepID=A0ABW1T0S5_9ACTN
MTRTARTLAVFAAAAATSAALLTAPGAGAAPVPEPAAAPAAVVPAAVTPAAKLRVRTSLSTSGFVSPVLVTSAKDGANRLYVVEKAGRIRWVKDGRIGGTYLDIRGLVSDSGEQGMLGLAFAPDFATSRYLWVTYTNSSGALVLARFRATTASASSVSASTRRTVLTVPHPTYQNHNGGNIAFGPDGALYLGTGDGGGGGDPFANGQDLTSLSGKILRVDVRCSTALYCLPADNPYAGSANRNARHVWMSGVRNPWRWSFDTNGTIWVGDVGQDKYEEVTYLSRATQKGADLGWSCWEARSRFNASRCRSGVTYRFPQIVVCHPSVSSNCPAGRTGESMTGGFVYRGVQYPGAVGTYVFADFITGKMWGYRAGDGWTPSHALGNVTGFGLSDSREIYAVTYGGGLYKVGFASV